jgi:DNA-binding transcriptional LysR family regulator
VPDNRIEEQEIHVRHELGDGETMLQAVLDGCGIAQFPTWLVHEHLRSGDLVTVLDEYAGATMPIHVIWPQTRYIQPKVRIVVDAMLWLAEQRKEIFLCADWKAQG